MKRLNKLASLDRPTDRDNEAKVRFLKRAVEGTKWGLHAQQWIPVQPLYQQLNDAV